MGLELAPTQPIDRGGGDHEADHFRPYGDYADARRTCVRA